MPSSNEPISWEIFKYLLVTAADDLAVCLENAKAVEDKKLPFGVMTSVSQRLTIIGDNLSRLATREVQPPA